MKIYVIENSRDSDYQRILENMLDEGWEIVWCAIVPSEVDNYKYKAILKKYNTDQIR